MGAYLLSKPLLEITWDGHATVPSRWAEPLEQAKSARVL
jgi:hypothetical protein